MSADSSRAVSSSPDSTAGEVTLLLRRAEQGDAAAAAAVLSLVYDELRRLARGRMANEAPGHTLQPTALVHEAWLRMGGDRQPAWESRRHFLGAAAEAMRRILIERSRRQKASRHGGGLQRVPFDDDAIVPREDEALAVGEAIERLSQLDAAKAELVKLRYFVGLSLEETAATLRISVPTATRWWAFARVWLFDEITRNRRDA